MQFCMHDIGPRRIWICLASPVLLAGCQDRQQTWSESEIEAIAYDAAHDVSGDAINIGALEDELRQAQQERDSLQLEIDGLRSDIGRLESEISLHSHY